MPHTNIIKLFLLLLSCTVRTACTLSVDLYESNFCYEDKSCGPNSGEWGGQCKTGSNQSPIDLPFVFQPFARHVELDFNEFYKNDGK